MVLEGCLEEDRGPACRSDWLGLVEAGWLTVRLASPSSPGLAKPLGQS